MPDENCNQAQSSRGTFENFRKVSSQLWDTVFCIELQMFLFSALVDCFSFPIQSKMEGWKKSIMLLDKEHSKEYKKVRHSIKKKVDYMIKLRKKSKKEPSLKLNKLIEQATQDLKIKYQVKLKYNKLQTNIP